MKPIEIYLSYLSCFLLLLAGSSSCTEDIASGASQGQIQFVLTTPDSGVQTRVSEEPGEDLWGENTLERIDMFIFTTGGSLVEYNAYTGLRVNSTCTVASNHTKTEFLNSDRFDVYVIANYPGDAYGLSSVTTIEALKALTATDADIYERKAERRFLMDGVKKGVQFNDGTNAPVTIPVELKRAAAKIKINLKCTEGFLSENAIELIGYSGYRFMNYTTETRTLNETEAAPIGAPSLARQTSYTPVTTAEKPFQPGIQEDRGCSFVVYSFANDWSGKGVDVNNATYFIVNLPYSPTGETGYKENYYKISINFKQFPTKEGENRLQRNTLYEVNATINKIGSDVEETPVILPATNYQIRKWIEKDVTVAEDEETVRYLMVSEHDVKMANITEYNGIEYHASNKVKIKGISISYTNNMGIEQTVGPTNFNDLGFGEDVLIEALEYNNESAPSRGSVLPVKESGNDITFEEYGNIAITSYLLDLKDTKKNSLLVKKFTFTVILDDGESPELKETITVTQYPEVYATQRQGWFSFKTPMSASTSSDPPEYTWAAYKQCDLNNIDTGIGIVTSLKNGYNGDKKDEDGYFYSKVIKSYTDGDSELSILNQWQWRDYQWSITPQWETLNNGHIYYVHITTIPDEKTLAYPHTTGDMDIDNSPANAATISPSFMIASQLGATTDFGSLENAYKHCQNYVEVTYCSPSFTGRINEGNYTGGNVSDWIVYSDWRLPTGSEIKVIANYQNNKGAVATVLTGKYYYSLTGDPENGKTEITTNNGSSSVVRCVRDVKPGDPNYGN